MKKEKIDNIITKPSWHNKSLDQTLQEINSSADGLTSSEAAARVSKYGKNTLCFALVPEHITGKRIREA